MEGEWSMNETMILSEVAPQALERARRLQYAIQRIQAGECRRKVSGQVHVKFGVSRPTAWRIVEMAWDMAGPIK